MTTLDYDLAQETSRQNAVYAGRLTPHAFVSMSTQHKHFTLELRRVVESIDASVQGLWGSGLVLGRQCHVGDVELT